MTARGVKNDQIIYILELEFLKLYLLKTKRRTSRLVLISRTCFNKAIMLYGMISPFIWENKNLHRYMTAMFGHG